MSAPRRQRWYWYSTQPSAHGGTGPFGPIEARTVREAYTIGEARARNAGVGLQHVIAAYRVEDTEAVCECDAGLRTPLNCWSCSARRPVPKAGKR